VLFSIVNFYVARKVERRDAYRVLVRKAEGKRPLGGTGVNGNIILKWVLKKERGRTWTGLIWLRIRTGGENL
jgi:hypothetical protein